MKKRGFTLIELIVAMVMAVLLLGALVPLMTMSQKMNYDGQRQTRVNQAGEAIYEYVAGQMRAANRVFVGYGTPGAPADALYPGDWESWNRITVDENGQLTVNGQTIYPDDYQQACTLQLEARGRDRTVLDLSVRLTDARGENNKGLLYEKESAVTLPNLTLDAFAQTEGLVGEALSAGTAGAAAAAAGAYGPLVLYYTADDMTVSPFPTPGGGVDPDGPGGGTGGTTGSFNVFLSPAQVTLKADASQKVQATVTKPAGWGEPIYAWSFDGGEYAVMEKNNDRAVTVTGKKSTEDAGERTLTLTVTVTDAEGNVQTKTVEAKVQVVEEKPDQPTDQFILVTKNNSAWAGTWGDDSDKDVNKQTLYWNVNDLSNGFSLLAKKVDSRLNGTWTVDEAAPQAFKDSCKYDPYYHYDVAKQGSIPTGAVTFTFTSDGTAPDYFSGVEKLKGQWATVTIVFYNPASITATLAFEENNTAAYTAPYPDNDSAIVGTQAATALLHIEAKDDDTEALLPTLLARAKISLDRKDGWDSDALLEKPDPVQLPVANLDGSYSIRIPLTYARKINSKTEESFDGITAAVTGGKITLSAGPITFTAKKNVPKLPTPILTFDDMDSKKETVYYYEDNLYEPAATAVLRFEFNEQSDAKYYEGYTVNLKSEAWNAADPLIQKMTQAVALQGPTQNSNNKKWMMTAQIPLKLMREPSGKGETVQFTGYAVAAPDQTSNAIQLTVTPPETGIVLRYGKYQANGRIVNGKTILVGRNTKNLEFTAYANSTSSSPLNGYWRSTRYFLNIFENNISDAADASGWPIMQRHANWYTDKQNSTGTRSGNSGSSVTVSFSEQWAFGGRVYVYVKLVDVDEIKTELTAEPDNVPAGKDVLLTLDTCYEKGADYTVEWKVSHSDLFQVPKTLTRQTGKGDEVSDQKSITLAAAPGAAVEKDTTVTVIATWKDESGNVIGTDEAEITVTPPAPAPDPPPAPEDPLTLYQQVYQGSPWKEADANNVTVGMYDPLTLEFRRNNVAVAGTWTSSDESLLPSRMTSETRYSQKPQSQREGTITLTFTENAAPENKIPVTVTVTW